MCNRRDWTATPYWEYRMLEELLSESKPSPSPGTFLETSLPYSQRLMMRPVRCRGGRRTLVRGDRAGLPDRKETRARRAIPGIRGLRGIPGIRERKATRGLLVRPGRAGQTVPRGRRGRLAPTAHPAAT